MALVRMNGRNVIRQPLTKSEMMQAMQVAGLRRVESIEASLDKNKHTIHSHLGTDFDGCCGEMAFAKFHGRYWSGDVNTFKQPDVGRIQVRATEYTNGHLLIRANDNPEELFTLVIVTKPNCFLAGSIKGKSGMRDEFFRKDQKDGKPCWWVPQSALKEMPEQGIPDLEITGGE